MDLASELGEQGFRWIFVMHNHGSPTHNLMLDQVGDFYRDVYKGRMVNLAGLLPKPAEPAPAITARERTEEGLFEVHAGMSETSSLLFLRPDLIPATYRSAKPFTANNLSDAFKLATASDWPGYIGSPRLATAAYGAQLMRYQSSHYNALALAILDGLDERTITRFSDVAFKDKTIADITAGAAKHWAGIERKQSEWMKKNGVQ